jgi:hypothetical protein
LGFADLFHPSSIAEVIHKQLLLQVAKQDQCIRPAGLADAGIETDDVWLQVLGSEVDGSYMGKNKLAKLVEAIPITIGFMGDIT